MDTGYIGLIQDEDNVVSPCRGSCVELPLGTNIVDVVEQTMGDGLVSHTDDTPDSSSNVAIQDLGTSRDTLYSVATMIPLGDSRN